jgi:hypothetical protein
MLWAGTSHAITMGFRSIGDIGADGTFTPGQVYNVTFAALQQGSPATGGLAAFDREFVGFITFDLSGITSFSSVTLNVTLLDTVTINPDITKLGVFGQTDGIGAGISGTDAELNGARTLLDTVMLPADPTGFGFAPQAYSIDLTSYFNSVLPRTSDNRAALRFDVLNDLSEIPPNSGNEGFGAGVSFVSLDAVEGPPPATESPTPATVWLLLGAFGGLVGLRRSRTA